MSQLIGKDTSRLIFEMFVCLILPFSYMKAVEGKQSKFSLLLSLSFSPSLSSSPSHFVHHFPYFISN